MSTITELSAALAALAALSDDVRTLPRITYTQDGAVWVELGGPVAVSIGTRHPVEVGSITVSEWNGRVRCVPVPVGVNPDALADLLCDPDVSALLARVMVGMGERWDGSNMVGTLTPDARAALDELNGEYDAGGIVERWELSTVGTVSAAEYLDPIGGDLCRLSSADDAAALALEGLAPDGVADVFDCPAYVGRAEVEAEARRIWAEGRAEA